MKVLIRVTDFYDGQEYGLEEILTTEKLESLMPFYLLDRINDMARMIDYDIDRKRRQDEARAERENDQ